ncbi:MAG: hypothetical protein H6668_15925 [Ardenticatenaceae bacterium]|nr:hypothetical protein [Ardenticatenaceae bacterium]
MLKVARVSCLLLLLAACRNVPLPDEVLAPTAVFSTATPIPLSPTPLPAPPTPTAIAIDLMATETAVLPATTTDLTAIQSRLETLAAQFEATHLTQSGWLYRQETVYFHVFPNSNATIVGYRNLDDTWVSEYWQEIGSDRTIHRQITHVYDTDGGLWERSAVVENKSVRVLPLQGVDERILTLSAPLSYRTAARDMLTILGWVQDEAGAVTAWEENGRFTIEITTRYDPPLSAETNSTGITLIGAKQQAIFDTTTGEAVEQRQWVINEQGEEILSEEGVVAKTAVFPTLPPLAAQTLLEADSLLEIGD